MKLKQYVWLVVCITLLGLVVGSSVWRAGGKQQRSAQKSSLMLLRKSADLPDRKDTPLSVSGSQTELAILVNNWHSRDVVNIRQGDINKIVVAAGSTLPAPIEVTSLDQMIKPASPVPDSSLSVTSDGVVFNRPVAPDNVVFLDIQIPSQTNIKIIVDGEVRLRGSLSQPLLLRGQEWMEGVQNVPAAMLRAAAPQYDKDFDLTRPVLDKSTGYYAISFSDLVVVYKHPVKAQAVVVLYINEMGQVERVVPLTETPPSNLNELLKKWRFQPYSINGQPVRVSAILTLKGST